MQRKEIVKLLAYLRQMYQIGTDEPELTIAIWGDALLDWDGQLIFDAAKEYVKTDTTGFAPKAGQLIAIARELRRTNHVNLQIPERIESGTRTEDEIAIINARAANAKAILQGKGDPNKRFYLPDDSRGGKI